VVDQLLSLLVGMKGGPSAAATFLRFCIDAGSAEDDRKGLGFLVIEHNCDGHPVEFDRT
jgi:hypothetical protein